MIHSKLHGIIDYMLVAILFLAPSLLEMSDTADTLSYVFAVVGLLLTAFTDFEPGIIRKIPFTTHRVIEFIIGAALIVSGFYLRSMEDYRGQSFFLVAGGAVILTWLLTDFSKVTAGGQAKQQARHAH